MEQFHGVSNQHLHRAEREEPDSVKEEQPHGTRKDQSQGAREEQPHGARKKQLRGGRHHYLPGTTGQQHLCCFQQQHPGRDQTPATGAHRQGAWPSGLVSMQGRTVPAEGLATPQGLVEMPLSAPT